jgi:anti-sigma factor (TIGR02949 family)
MYSCKDSIHLLADFLDDELRPDLRASLEEHLAGCPPCLEFIRSYKATSGICKKALAASMPEELSARLHDFLRHRVGK